MNAAAFARTTGVVIFVVCLVANLWFSSVGWNHSLHELHEFRQFQTALTTRAIQEEGWKLAYPTPLFGPPWSAPLEFPFYQVCTAWVSTVVGMPTESAGRLVSLSFFYLSLPACFLLLRHIGIPPRRRWLFLALILVSPLYLYYSRSFMIESLALCAAAWFLHAYSRAVETRRLGWILGAVTVGAIAALAKVTTFVVFLFPAIALTLHQLRPVRLPHVTSAWRRFLPGVVGLVIAACALAAGYAWIVYADGIKASNPLSAFLVSHRLSEWNYGTLAQRLDLSFWRTLLHHSTAVIVPIGGMLALALALWSTTATRGRLLILVLCYLGGPLLFSNLYFTHDYYFYATGFFLLAAVMVGWNALIDDPRIPLVITGLVIGLTLAAQLFSFHRTYFGVQARGDITAEELPRALNRITRPDDLVLFQGLMWNPTLPYESGRKAIMVTDENARNPAALNEVLSRVPPGSVGAMVVGGSMLTQATAIQELVRSLALHPQPLLSSETTQVFVAQRLVTTAVPRIELMRLTSLKLQAPVDAEFHGIPQRRYRVTDLPDPAMVAMFNPRPTSILAPFPVFEANIDGATAFHAHAPTDITFNVPSSAQTVRAAFGISAEAYAGPSTTDGVDFRVDLIAPDGTATTLFQRTLTPATSPSDRGTQHCEIALPAHAAGGQLIFRTLPGPSQSIAFDWAYWLRVEIQ